MVRLKSKRFRKGKHRRVNGGGKTRSISYKENLLMLQDFINVLVSEILKTKGLKKIDFSLIDFENLEPKIKKRKVLSRYTVENIYFYEVDSVFYKRYSCIIDKRENKEILELCFNSIINEADCQLFANSIMKHCGFVTPNFERLCFFVKENDDDFILEFTIEMELIDLEKYRIGGEFTKDDIMRLEKINKCLKENGLIHNDLASRNVGFNDTEVLLIDWGESFFHKNGYYTLERNHPIL